MITSLGADNVVRKGVVRRSIGIGIIITLSVIACLALPVVFSFLLRRKPTTGGRFRSSPAAAPITAGRLPAFLLARCRGSGKVLRPAARAVFEVVTIAADDAAAARIEDPNVCIESVLLAGG